MQPQAPQFDTPRAMSDPLPVIEPGTELPRSRLAAGLALGLAVFLVGAQLIVSLTAHDGASAQLRDKLDFLEAYGAGADVILVGTSRTFYGLDPLAFAEGAAAQGCNWTALNLGVAMLDRAAEHEVQAAVKRLPARPRIVLFETLPSMLSSLVTIDRIDFTDIARYALAAARVQENRTDLSLDVLWAANRIVASSVLTEALELRGPTPMQLDPARGGQLVAASYGRAPPPTNLVVYSGDWLDRTEDAPQVADFIALRREEIAGPWLGGLYALPAILVTEREAILGRAAADLGMPFFNLNDQATLAQLSRDDWDGTWHLNAKGAAIISRHLGMAVCARFGPDLSASSSAGP